MISPLTIYLIVVTFFLWIFILTAISNLFFYPHLRSTPQPDSDFLLSICIPARNESAGIGQTISSILAQTYTNFELLILDDQSIDQTADIVAGWAKKDGRVKLFRGEPLPEKWLGKNWACHQLSQHARGEMLLFTDADVTWKLEALATLLAHQKRTQAALLTVWPNQITTTWSERLIVPLMKFAIFSYLPIAAVHYLPWSIFAAANGQVLLFTKEQYQAIRGHQAVRNQIVEDVAFAQAVKRSGGRLRMVDGGSLIYCRMYQTWSEVLKGFGKNILAGHGNSVLFLATSTIWHWAAFVVPWVLVLVWPIPAVLFILLSAIILRFLSEMIAQRQPVKAFLHAFAMPLGVILMTRIALQAVWWRFGEGPEWKGRKAL